MAKTRQKNKVKDRSATEERLLLAAEQVFSEHGFQGATTRMIATKADVNLSLINRYFDGKYGLMMAIIENKAIRFGYSELPYPPQETLCEECHKFAMLRAEQYLEDVNLFKITLVQYLTDPKFLKKFQDIITLFENHPEFEERIQKLLDSNKVTCNNTPRMILETINQFVCGIIVGRVLFHNDSKEVILQRLEHFIKNYCGNMEVN